MNYTIAGRLLKDCPDSLLFGWWGVLAHDPDPVFSCGGLLCSIEAEVSLRRGARAKNGDHWTVDPFP